jgi:hypothetical protein
MDDSGMAYHPDEARKLPYATLDAKIGISLNSLMVLARYSGPDLHWMGADNVVLVTRQGRLIATNGMEQDLLKTELWGPDPIINKTPAEGQSVRVVDLKKNNLYGITVDCEWNDLGPDIINIYGIRYNVKKITEDCKARQIDWIFQNTFWRDERNFVWKSKQNFSPDVPTLEMSLLRPIK